MTRDYRERLARQSRPPRSRNRYIVDNPATVARLVSELGGYRPLARWLGDEGWNVQLWRIVNEPDFVPSAGLAGALGDPPEERHIVAQACPCGAVHVRATCSRGRALARRRRSEEPAFLRFVQEVAVPFLVECRQK